MGLALSAAEAVEMRNYAVRPLHPSSTTQYLIPPSRVQGIRRRSRWVHIKRRAVLSIEDDGWEQSQSQHPPPHPYFRMIDIDTGTG